MDFPFSLLLLSQPTCDAFLHCYILITFNISYISLFTYLMGTMDFSATITAIYKDIIVSPFPVKSVQYRVKHTSSQTSTLTIY